MAQAPGSTSRLRRRLLGYDRKAVDAALATAADRLQKAEARRDELIETTANVERIGAQVADMLRSLADRAVELELEAATQAAQVVRLAELEASQIRTQAAAVLADAEAAAAQMVESSRQRQALIGERRETALISLRIAMDQMGRLATTIDQIDLTAPEVEEPVVPGRPAAAETVVLPPSIVSTDPPERDEGSSDTPIEDPIAPILSRIEGWASSAS